MTWPAELLTLDQFGGGWTEYIEAVYAIFVRDFVNQPPTFRGRRFAMKRHPEFQGKEATFWHVTSEGMIEAERIPDLRRCERIHWPRQLVDAVDSDRVKCWTNTRGRDQRIVIALPDFSYVVILADRGDFVLLWTAYPVELGHRRDKFRREYVRSQTS
jgi:hypothetical protein